MQTKYTFLVFGMICVLNAKSQITPKETIGQMGRGINIGNTLEAPTETGWGNPLIQEYYFDDFKAAGFNCVRIPVRWDPYTGTTSPYTINETRMVRIEQVVDWALERGLFVIINSHHDDWIKQNYNNTNKARFDSIWSQISVRFKDKSEKLIFEMINEPNGLSLDNVNDLNQRVLGIIRKTNPTRIVCFSGHNWSNSAELIAAAVPNDPYVIGYFHSYDPSTFALDGIGTWGSQSNINDLISKFNSVSAWSGQKQVPVNLGEFGAVKACDYNSRMKHYASYVEQALSHGFAFQVWDNGGDFKVYERQTRKWDEIKDILVHYSDKAPGNFACTIVDDTNVLVSWTNRDAKIDSIIVERRLLSTSYSAIAKFKMASPTVLEDIPTSYTDSGLTVGESYYYRVRVTHADSLPAISYPQSVTIPLYIRYPYLGKPFEVPCVIEAEDFDFGGEGLTYHDSNAGNTTGAYRPNEDVDIESRDDGGYQIGNVVADEWLEYTIDIPEDGVYRFDFIVASLNGSGKLKFKAGNSSTKTVLVTKTNGWQINDTIGSSIQVAAGEQILRLTIGSLPEFKIDKIFISKYVGIDDQGEIKSFDIFPNPVNDYLYFNSTFDKDRTVGIFTLDGRQLTEFLLLKGQTSLPLCDLQKGIYLLKIEDDNGCVSKKFVKN